MNWKIRFFCFVSLEEGLCPLFKPHFCECVVNKILWIAALHKVLFKFCNGFFTNSRGPTRVYFWAFPDTSELSLCTLKNVTLYVFLPNAIDADGTTIRHLYLFNSELFFLINNRFM